MPGGGRARTLPGVPLPRLLDAALDRLVIPGYSRLGYLARSAGWTRLPTNALAGRTVAVTGASAGLGEATVAGLVGLGAAVEMVVRDRGRGEAARDRVLERYPDARITVARCDLSDLDDVRRYAADARDRLIALHGLVHNAGVLPAERTETAAGHELCLATHVLGPFLLTRELVPLLRAGSPPDRPGSPARVVFVSSGGMYTASLRTDDPEFLEGRFSGGAAYARTKRMQVVLAELLAEDLAVGGHRRAQHASGLGRHPRHRGIDAGVPPAHRSAAADGRAGRRHRGLAAGRPRARALQRGVLARPGAPPHPLPVRRAGGPGAPGSAVGAVRGRHRDHLSVAPYARTEHPGGCC